MNNFARVVALGAVSLLSACGAAQRAPCDPVGSNFVPYSEPRACWFETRYDVAIDCGLLHVAEVEGEASACRLSIAWARLTPPQREPGAEPVFLLGGGPGDPLLSRMDDVVARMSKAAPNRVVIAHDPRGVGHSSPALDCTDPAIHESGPIRSTAEWLARCAAFQRERGQNLDQYRSRVLARDVVTLADALEVRTFDVVGVSFGSKLAQTLTQAYPERLRAVVLDAATPVETRLFEGPAEAARRAIEALFAACVADQTCAATHGDLALAFQSTTERLRATPATIVVHGKRVDYGASAFVHAVLSLLRDGLLLPAAPAFIREIERGDYASAQLLLEGARPPQTSLLMNSAVLCAEELPWNEPAEAAADLSRFPDYGMTSNYEQAHGICAAISITPEPASVKAPLETALPILATTGHFDPLSPGRFWNDVTTRFPHGRHLDFADSGHGVLRHPCGQEVIASFLAAPSNWVVPSCYENLAPPPFVNASSPLLRARLLPGRP